MSLRPFATSRAHPRRRARAAARLHPRLRPHAGGRRDPLRLLGKRKGRQRGAQITDSMIGAVHRHLRGPRRRAGAAHGITRRALVRAADKLGVALSGGGTPRSRTGASAASSTKPRFPPDQRALRLPEQTVHHLRPARASAVLRPTRRWCCCHGMNRFIPHLIALSASSPLRAGHRHHVPLGAPELGVRVPALGPRALRADLAGLRHLLRQDGAHRRRPRHEGLLLGHPPQTRSTARSRCACSTRRSRSKAAAMARPHPVPGALAHGGPAPSRREDDTCPTPSTASGPTASGWKARSSTRAPASTARCAGHRTHARSNGAACAGAARRGALACAANSWAAATTPWIHATRPRAPARQSGRGDRRYAGQAGHKGAGPRRVQPAFFVAERFFAAGAAPWGFAHGLVQAGLGGGDQLAAWLRP